MKGTHLEGLEGTNPLGFLAAIGVQVAFAGDGKQPHLWWSDDVTPHAVVDEDFRVDRIADRALESFAAWKDSAALNPRRADGTVIPKGDELKLEPDDIGAYLAHATAGADKSGDLAMALVAEGSLDKQGVVAKPSDFYFTAGQMKFLSMARKVLGGVERSDLDAGLVGPWRYDSPLPSLGWDVVDDRVYALRSRDPGQEKKLTNPGAEALALLGLSQFPVFAGHDRTLTTGFSGTWKSGRFSWPLWRKRATPSVVRSMLAHVGGHSDVRGAENWYGAWGVFDVLMSPVRRSGQGGYGTFGPPESVWREDAGRVAP